MATKPGAVYVIRRAGAKSYLTRSKSRREALYWGSYIGKPGGKRYSAVRFNGGPDFDELLAAHPDWIAVEVEG